MHELVKRFSGIEVVADDYIVVVCGATIEETTDDHDQVLTSVTLTS